MTSADCFCMPACTAATWRSQDANQDSQHAREWKTLPTTEACATRTCRTRVQGRHAEKHTVVERERRALPSEPSPPLVPTQKVERGARGCINQEDLQEF